ncbi:MAG: polyisoprenoid-binding protein, partial [Alphaproteobacteria bacterium]
MLRQRSIGRKAVLWAIAMRWGMVLLPVLMAVALPAGCARLQTGLGVLTHLPSGDPASIRPGHYVTDPDHRFLMLEVAHLGYARVLARFERFAAEMDLDPAHPERFHLVARIDAASFSTGVAGIDEAVRRLLKVEAHPVITYEASRITRTGDNTARMDGRLTIAGRAAPVAVDVTFNGAAPNPLTRAFTAGFSGTGRLSRSAFGFSRWVPAVGDEVA